MENSKATKLLMVGLLLIVTYTVQAQTYTQRSAFDAATTNTAETLNFDGQASGTTVSSGSNLNVGATISNATFTYALAGGAQLYIDSPYPTTSGANLLRRIVGGSAFDFMDNDAFTMTFAQPVRAVGLYVIVKVVTAVFFNDWNLSANGTTTSSSTSVSSGINVSGSEAYFLGIRDNAGFTSVTFAGTNPSGTGLSYSIDDIVIEQRIAAANPELDVRNNADNADIIDDGTTISPALGTDFGNVCVDGGTQTSTFRAENNGTGTLTFGADALAISNTTDFTILTDITNSSTLAASGLATFTIQFDPVSAGTKTCTVTLRSDDADEDPYTFQIEGVGTEPAVSIVAQAPTAIAENSGSSLVYRFLRNSCSTNALTVNFSIDGTSTATVTTDYTVTSGGTGNVTFNTGTGTGTVTFPAGVATVDVSVAPVGDTSVEPNETIIINVANP